MEPYRVPAEDEKAILEARAWRDLRAASRAERTRFYVQLGVVVAVMMVVFLAFGVLIARDLIR